jgi:hypothetical protein
VDLSAEGADADVAVSSLPTYAPCFITEIENGFDAWAAVADITFVEVADDGLPFNEGAEGEIRIGAHTLAVWPSPPAGGGRKMPVRLAWSRLQSAWIARPSRAIQTG